MNPRPSADVAIIGGGIVGAATAYFLSKEHVDSIICERQPNKLEASGNAYGGLYPLSGVGIPGPLYELARFAFELHKDLAADFGEKWKYQKRASITLALTKPEANELKRHIGWVNEKTSFKADWMDTDATLAVDSRINSEVAGAGYYHDAMEVDPTLCTNGLRDASGCAVEQGNVSEICTDDDRYLEIKFHDRKSVWTRYAVVTAGPWTASIGPCMKLARHVVPLKGQILRLSTTGYPIEQSIGYQGNYITTKWDGLAWAGTTEEHTGFATDSSQKAQREILDKVLTMLPGLHVANVVRQTACLRPMSGDGLPILGRLDSDKRIFVGTGGGRKGILLAPAMGRLLAEMIFGTKQSIASELFAPQRFR